MSTLNALIELPHFKKSPVIPKSCFIAPGAHVVGDVTFGEDSSLWFNAVVRGDVNRIVVGNRSNIQDLSVVHVSSYDIPTVVGDDVTVGHGVILHACTIGNRVLIGMGSIVMDGAVIEDNVILGAGSLVTQGTKIPKGSRAFGRPAKVVGTLTDQERERILWSSTRYQDITRVYRESFAGR
ncbi:MAG: gamma carbonic anhydrase family protein [Deltaproteobacteria bacterium]|nr:gamma carbonic anhydrase family protein [Deltaproteobacteria bacterium]MBI3293302.1 gamma carbonic anhydrase family protein [Deltaproteobacteria bacterium]